MNKINCPMCGKETTNEEIFAYANGTLYQICPHCDSKYELQKMTITIYKALDLID